MFASSENCVNQFGDATSVGQDGSEQNPIFYFVLFIQDIPHKLLIQKVILNKSILT